MSNLRRGLFGEYYGSYYNESKALTQSQMEKNAQYIYSYLLVKGWTVEAIAGLLGNMQHESSINPGRWQSNNVGNTSSGYSLVQWTPATKYINWCTDQGFSDPSEMDNALARIVWEMENNVQYAATSGYPESFREFSESTKSPYYLACAFAWNYERSNVVLNGTEEQKEALRKRRGGDAESWYTFLTGVDPIPPDPGGGGSGTTKKRTGYKFVLFGKRRRTFYG
jgi:hypothetical protein